MPADPENFLKKALQWLFGAFVVIMVTILLIQHVLWPFLRQFWNSVTGSGP
ncbi:hypothetical protein HY464_00850 [Candidatus Peregrinibacteria bacterium]|nr:hypothetical protein [Candidatus Peregrinibacteria bacterium]